MEKLEIIDKSKTLKDFVFVNKNLSSCMLILSDDDLILDAMAKYFVMALNCKSKYPCFNCGACKKIINNNAIEVNYYPRAKKTIVVEDVENIISSVYTRPLDFDKRFFVLNRIDLANTACQNKLLKTMEELPPYAVFILTAKSKSEVLPTIISRCNVFTVPLLKMPEAVEILKTNGEEVLSPSMAFELSMNNIVLADKMMNDSLIKEIYKNSLDIFTNIKKENFIDYVDIIEKGQTADYIKIMSAITGRLIEIKSGKNDDELYLLSEKFSLLSLTNLIADFNSYFLKLKSYTNEQSIIDNLLISIMENKTK